MRPTIIQPLASTSRQIITRSYAASPSTNPHLASPSDTRTEIIRRVLYPADAFSPNSASPTGAYHPDHIKRLNHLIPNPEVYETIERAWKLDQRRKRDSRQKSLAVKLKAMQEACDELDRLTEVEGGLSRSVYDRAMSRPNLKGEKVEQGKKETPESRWAAARIEGLVPREMWVPTETRGKGWKYDWQRPGK
jgi:large subunit ribosomal protein L40